MPSECVESHPSDFTLMELETDDRVWEVARRSVCITGVGRSGTTILGTLIYSLDQVEYHFEPPSLVYLLHCVEEIDPDTFRYIFAHIVYSEILGRSLAGRNLNFNSHDWSYVFKAKTLPEVRHRFQNTMAASDFHNTCGRFTPAFKIPDIIRQAGVLGHRIPGIRRVAMIRNPRDTIASMVQRHWYSDPISFATSGAIKRSGEQLVPYGLKPEIADDWIRMTHADRASAIYVNEYEDLLENADFIIVDYDRLLKSPEGTLRALCHRLELSFGPNTARLLKEVSPRNRTSVGCQGSSRLRESAADLYARALSRALPAHD